MKIAKALKVIVIIEWVLGFIYGIIVGSIGTYGLYSDYGLGFNFMSMLTAWVLVFIMGMFQYGFAELIEDVAILRQRTDEQLQYLIGAVQRVEGAVLHAASKNNDSAGGNI